MKNKIYAFTLIEMMVTISIIAIIASIAVPHFSTQISQYKFNSETKEILSLMSMARAQAILLKKDVKINLTKNASDKNTETNFFWDAQTAQIKSPTRIEFDMLGLMKARPTNGCIAITHVVDSTLMKALTVSVLGGVDAVKENTSC